jgi:hypothetical protein
MMRILLMLFLLLLSLEVISQTKDEEKNIATIDSIVQKNLVVNKMDVYLIYSVGNNIVVIDSLNKQFHYIERFSKKKSSTKKLSTRCIKSIFDDKNIKEGDLFSNKKFDNSCVSSYAYLSLIKKGSKVFQFHLPFMLMCDENKIEYPFNIKTLEKLQRILNECLLND